MNIQQRHHQPESSKLISTTSQDPRDSDKNKSDDLNITAFFKSIIENSDHFYDDDMNYHYRYY
jgi:hypothetical protein